MSWLIDFLWFYTFSPLWLNLSFDFFFFFYREEASGGHGKWSVWGRPNRVLLPYSSTWKDSHDGQSQKLWLCCRTQDQAARTINSPYQSFTWDSGVLLLEISHHLHSFPRTFCHRQRSHIPGLQMLWTKNLSLFFSWFCFWNLFPIYEDKWCPLCFCSCYLVN